MPIRLEIEGVDPLVNGMQRTDEALAAEIRPALTTSLLLLEAEIKRRAPRDTGRLQGSVHYTITGSGTNLVGEVGPSVQYALFVERGTKPHFPPLGAISGWARRHGIHPFLVGRAIARRGNRAQPFVAPAFRQQLPAIERAFAQTGARVVRRIVG